MNISGSITMDGSGVTACAACCHILGDATSNPLSKAIVREQPSTAAGPGIRENPKLYTDRPIVLRQAFCPACLTLLSTEVVPGDEPTYRSWRMLEKRAR